MKYPYQINLCIDQTNNYGYLRLKSGLNSELHGSNIWNNLHAVVTPRTKYHCYRVHVVCIDFHQIS